MRPSRRRALRAANTQSRPRSSGCSQMQAAESKTQLGFGGKKKKRTNRKTPNQLFCLPCSSCSRGCGAWPGPWRACGQQRGTFLLLSLLFLVKVRQALTPHAVLPARLLCLGKAARSRRGSSSQGSGVLLRARGVPLCPGGFREPQKEGDLERTEPESWGSPSSPCWGGCCWRWRRWRGAVSAAAACGDER